jgi:tripartite-type tricarboxylate transporter receptor subunit TctC
MQARRATALALTIALSALPGAAAADTYPSRPITMVVPFPAGSPLDTIARVMSEQLQMRLGQPLVVENVAGAAGSVGVGRVARATGDGYTIGVGNFSSHVVTPAIQSLPYDVVKDFEPVVQLANNAQIIVSKTALASQNLPELLAWLKANPDKASAGTAGVGSVSHVAALLFQKATGTRFQFVAYRGINLAQQDLIGGHIDLLFDQAANALPNVRAGKVRAYAVTARKRLEAAPEIPTVDEAGVRGLHMSVWSGLWVPKGTAREVVAKINAAAIEALVDPSVRKRFADLGLNVPPREELTPNALAELHRGEVQKWWPIIKAANIKAE